MHIDSMMWDIGLQDAAAYGQKCERIGYDCVWTYEAAHNPFMPLAQVAAATENIHIGTNIAVAFARSPYAMAQAAWDLADVSKGRFHLGVGSQVRAHVERRFSAEFVAVAGRELKVERGKLCLKTRKYFGRAAVVMLKKRMALHAYGRPRLIAMRAGILELG